jgi:hypothetical protein
MSKARDLADGTFDTDTLVVDAGNNRVGIGTATPNQPLTVTTNSSAQGINIAGRSSDNRAYMFFSDNNGTTYRGSIHTIPADNRFNINAYSGENITFSNNGAEKVRIDSSGRVTMPYQPAFLVQASSSFTGDGSVGGNELFGYTNALVNVGSHFNTTTKTFTAPVNGNYAVNWWASASTNSDSARYIRLRLTKNGSTYLNPHNTISDETNNSDYNLVGGSAIVPLSSGDTINVTWGSSIASSEITFYQDMCFFSGYLIG